MIAKEITITPNDYNILINFVGELHNRIDDKKLLDTMMGEIGSISIWDRADLSNSEELYGNPLIRGDRMQCIKDNKLHSFKMINKIANKGALVYITKGSFQIPDSCIGKFYRVSDMFINKPRIRVIDTYSDCPDRLISLDNNQYIVLEKI